MISILALLVRYRFETRIQQWCRWGVYWSYERDPCPRNAKFCPGRMFLIFFDGYLISPHFSAKLMPVCEEVWMEMVTQSHERGSCRLVTQSSCRLTCPGLSYFKLCPTLFVTKTWKPTQTSDFIVLPSTRRSYWFLRCLITFYNTLLWKEMVRLALNMGSVKICWTVVEGTLPLTWPERIPLDWSTLLALFKYIQWHFRSFPVPLQSM